MIVVNEMFWLSGGWSGVVVPDPAYVSTFTAVVTSAVASDS